MVGAPCGRPWIAQVPVPDLSVQVWTMPHLPITMAWPRREAATAGEAASYGEGGGPRRRPRRGGGSQGGGGDDSGEPIPGEAIWGKRFGGVALTQAEGVQAEAARRRRLAARADVVQAEAARINQEERRCSCQSSASRSMSPGCRAPANPVESFDARARRGGEPPTPHTGQSLAETSLTKGLMERCLAEGLAGQPVRRRRTWPRAR